MMPLSVTYRCCGDQSRYEMGNNSNGTPVLQTYIRLVREIQVKLLFILYTAYFLASWCGFSFKKKQEKKKNKEIRSMY